MKKQNKQKGFTLVELVIVIAVIAILAGVLIPTFSGIVEKANASAALQEAKNALTQDLVLAEADYINIPSSKPIYQTYTDESGETKYYEKVSITSGSLKGYYKLTTENGNKMELYGDTEQVTDDNKDKIYKLVEGAYQGTYNDSKYTYDNGKYTCVYDASNGGWTTTKNN